MRKWFVPIAVLGLGSIGAVLLTERGRDALRALFRNLDQAPDRFLEWNDGLPEELDRIQATLDRVAKSIDLHPEIGS